MRYVSTRGRGAGGRLRRRRAGRPGARRRPLCARGLAAASRRTRSPPSPARPTPRSPPTVLGALRRRRDRAAPTCWRCASEAYATFTHAAVAPLRAAGRRASSCSSCSTARPWPSRTWPCSSWPGSTTTSLARQGPHPDHRLRHLRRHRRRGGRGLPRARRTSRLVVLFPEGRITEVQRRFMTTAGATPMSPAWR